MRVETETSVEVYNFYGVNRFSTEGVAPGQRVDEGVEFEVLMDIKYGGDNEILGIFDRPDEIEKLNIAIMNHAKKLLTRWLDQEGIAVRECGQSDVYTTLYRGEV